VEVRQVKIDRRETRTEVRTVHVKVDLDDVQVRNTLFNAVAAEAGIAQYSPQGRVDVETSRCGMTDSTSLRVKVEMSAKEFVPVEDSPAPSTGNRSSLALAKAAATKIGDMRSAYTAGYHAKLDDIDHLKRAIEAIVEELERVS
jgi:hypothetical protein